MQEWIELKGVKQNNLKNISLKLPRNKFIVITGVSGSGKSSLAFEVINNEGRRKYFINLSGHARKYLDKLEKPNADCISGLSPTIAVSQYQNNHSPRSTVGTISEIYDYLRLLFARLGKSENIDLEISRSLFSFNSPEGACPHCNGLGLEDKIDANLFIEDENKSIRDRAFKITNPQGYIIYSQVTIDALEQVCQAHGFNVDIPWKDLNDEQKDIVLNGSKIITIPYGKHTLESRMKWSGITAKPREEGYYKGILPVMNDILKRDRNPNILRFAKTIKCTLCHGKRLSEQALSVRIDGLSIDELSTQSLDELYKSLAKLQIPLNQKTVAEQIIQPIQKRITLLKELGLGYLSCSRTANTLSGGEIQRLRLAKQIASGLRNITFVFDEPSAGVHPVVNHQIIHKLKELVNNGNTVITVEHDEETMRQADWIVEIGPHAGYSGGEIMFSGTKNDFIKSNHKSLTLDYLQKRKTIEIPFLTNKKTAEFSIRNANINNLKNIAVSFKYNSMNVITGVSGAGKSSLLFQTLIPLANNTYYNQIHAKGQPQLENFTFSRVLHVDQSAIGKTARSTPATYTKIFDSIRKLYAKLPEAKEGKYTQSSFSYNTVGGRCEKCEGAGKIETGMHFLGNIEKTCDYCHGKRYSEDLNKIKYKGKSIADVLDLSFNQANDFFIDEPTIQKQLSVVKDIGLGYLKLGQSSNSLSGGESQRIRLATELIKGNTNNSLYVFNEPSSGLHFHDIQILLNLFAQLLQQGHTILVIEHNSDIIRNAHHIIDLGPEGGKKGGNVIFSGAYNELINCHQSLTSQSISQGSKTSESIPVRNNFNKPIILNGVRTNNLKGINIQIPVNKITAIIGKSGSGKSSLAFDTLFSESQNRFTESFPNYIRQFSSHYSQARFDSVSGLTPVIGLRQKNQIQDARSTLGTFTEIYDLYRLLYSRFGNTPCPNCNSNLQNGYFSSCNKPVDIKYSASHFSFNQAEGSCAICSGVGTILTSNAQLLLDNPHKSLFDGAFKNHKSIQFYADPSGQYLATLKKVGERFNIDYSQAVHLLDQAAIDKAFFGTSNETYEVEWQFKRKNRIGTHNFKGKWQGFVALILDEYYRKKANGKGDDLFPFLTEEKCLSCQGRRLNHQVLEVKFQGLNIAELSELSITESLELFRDIYHKISSKEFEHLDNQLIENIQQKLSALDQMGLGYLQMSRKTASLSGGEYQRTLIGIQLNGNLSGITYILDEPGTGLHPTDFPIIIKAIQRLKKLGNTIVLTDHNPDIIQTADYLIELGPDSGINGGEIVYSGKPQAHPYLLYKKSELCFKHEVTSKHNEISIKQAKANNLKNIDVQFKTNQLNVVCGVSGSGKTSLVKEVLLASYKANQAVNCKSIAGLNHKNKMHWVSSSKNLSSQSIVAGYLGVYDEIKKSFAKQPLAKGLRLKATDFSFHSKGGQCPVCKGQGEIRVKLDFINDVSTICESCNGKRFISKVLRVKYKGLSISDILNLSIAETLNFFAENGILKQKIELIQKIGLSYLRLNQQLQQLSSGEFQRAKIVREILTTDIQNGIFLFDEPSKGLHKNDLDFLFELFQTLLNLNCTLIIIEHNPLIIDKAHHIIELGEGAGELGGDLIFQGNFAKLISNSQSKTARYYREALKYPLN